MMMTICLCNLACSQPWLKLLTKLCFRLQHQVLELALEIAFAINFGCKSDVKMDSYKTYGYHAKLYLHQYLESLVTIALVKKVNKALFWNNMSVSRIKGAIFKRFWKE